MKKYYRIKDRIDAEIFLKLPLKFSIKESKWREKYHISHLAHTIRSLNTYLYWQKGELAMKIGNQTNPLANDRIPTGGDSKGAMPTTGDGGSPRKVSPGEGKPILVSSLPGIPNSGAAQPTGGGPTPQPAGKWFSPRCRQAAITRSRFHPFRVFQTRARRSQPAVVQRHSCRKCGLHDADRR